MKSLFKYLLIIFIMAICLPERSTAQTDCVILKSNCPPADLIPACADTVVGGVFGAYVNWTPPDFTLSCTDGHGGGYNFFMSYDLPEVKNECWIYSQVQRIGSGRLRLWQSTQTNSDPNPNFMTPSFFLPLSTINGSITVSNNSGNILTCNIFLVYPDGTHTPLNSTFLITETNEYVFSITPPQEGVYRLYFQFTGDGDNHNYVDELKLDALLDGTSCSEDIDYSIVTDNYPGRFFPVGSTPVTYTATCNNCIPVITETCSFNVIVNGVNASAVKTDATCGLNNGTITITAASSNATPALQYNLNNSGWVSFSSPVTITGLAQGNYTINVRDFFSNNSSYCRTLSPVSINISRIIDNTPPTISCPGGLIIDGCNASAVTAANSGFNYSPVQQTISFAQFTAAGGSAFDACGIVSVKYQDTQSGLCPVVTRTFSVFDANGNTTTCSQTITIRDPEPPDFIGTNKDFCVGNISNANFNMTTLPEWYTLSAGSTELDISGFSDNCTPIPGLTVRWQIDFAGGGFITGSGQPSSYGSEIRFDGSLPGNVVHRITYWLRDQCGNETVKIFTITIHPRPEVNT